MFLVPLSSLALVFFYFDLFFFLFRPEFDDPFAFAFSCFFAESSVRSFFLFFSLALASLSFLLLLLHTSGNSNSPPQIPLCSLFAALSASRYFVVKPR